MNRAIRLVYIIRPMSSRERAVRISNRRLGKRSGRDKAIRRAVELYNTALLDQPRAVIKAPSPDKRIKLPIPRAQPLRQFVPPLLHRVAGGPRLMDPLLRGALKVLDDGGAFIEEALPCGVVGHEVVLVGLGLEILVRPGVVAAEFLDDVAALDERFKLVDVFGEVDFAGDDGIKPAFDDVPDA